MIKKKSQKEAKKVIKNSSSSKLNSSVESQVKWTFKEPKINYSAKWYILMGLFFLSLILIAIFLIKSTITAVLFGVVFVTLIIHTKRPRDKFKFLIDKDGIYINDTLYAMKRYKFYTIREVRDYFNLIFIPKRRFETELVISFEEKTGEKLVDFLNQYLELKQTEESFIDKVIKKIGL